MTLINASTNPQLINTMDTRIRPRCEQIYGLQALLLTDLPKLKTATTGMTADSTVVAANQYSATPFTQQDYLDYIALVEGMLRAGSNATLMGAITTGVVRSLDVILSTWTQGDASNDFLAGVVRVRARQIRALRWRIHDDLSVVPAMIVDTWLDTDIIDDARTKPVTSLTVGQLRALVTFMGVADSATGLNSAVSARTIYSACDNPLEVVS